jgi:hypothetical protein
MVVKSTSGAVFAIAALSSCSSQTYDDCLLAGLEGKNSDSAVTAVEDACRRKFELRVNRQLEIQPKDSELTLAALEKQPKYIVTNNGPSIVTQIIVTAPQGEWTINTWLERDRWDAFDVPTSEVESFMKSLRSEEIRVQASKEIPLQ